MGTKSETVQGFDVDKSITRALLYIEDGKTAEADELLDKVIDEDPQNENAYIAKLLIEANVTDMNELIDSDVVIFDSKNLKRAIRFAPEELKKQLENIKLENIYRNACSKYEKATTDIEYDEAKSLFERIPDYKESSVYSAECIQKGKQSRIEATYAEAKNLVDSSSQVTSESINKLNQAIQKFETIIDYQDSAQQIELCKTKLDKLTADVNQKKKKASKIRIFAGAALIVAIAGFLAAKYIVIPMSHYNNAVSMMDSGNYDAAIKEFTELGTYKDSAEKIKECDYRRAESYYSENDYENAGSYYGKLIGYKDSQDKFNECEYKIAESFFSAGDYEQASDHFENVISYSDSQDRYNESIYRLAQPYYDKKDLDHSNPLYEKIKGYKDSEKRIHYHEWQAATCTEPKTCKTCGETEGEALGHTGTTKCTRCGETLFETLSFEGTGKDVVSGINLPEGKYAFTITSTSGFVRYGTGYFFSVWFHPNISNQYGDEIKELLENAVYEKDTTNTSTAFYNGSSNDGHLEVDCQNCSWSITIEAR